MVTSVRTSVCVSVWVYSGHYRSEGFVCLSVISTAFVDNRADAVDRLLIQGWKLLPVHLSRTGKNSGSFAYFHYSIFLAQSQSQKEWWTGL